MTDSKKNWPKYLHQLMADAAYKIHLRAKRHDPAKWPEDGVDEEGNRDWNRCSLSFLLGKLAEEVDELQEAVVDYDQLITTSFDDLRESRSNIRYEAADVTALAMMLAERSGAYQQLPPLPRIVCLCGSTRFKDAFMEANFKETMSGNIVLSVGFFHHAETERHALTAEEKVELDHLHKRKIDLADEILVLNVGGYVGESTRSEIEHAYRTAKSVRYLELPLEVCDGQHARVTSCADPGCWLSNPMIEGAA